MWTRMRRNPSKRGRGRFRWDRTGGWDFTRQLLRSLQDRSSGGRRSVYLCMIKKTGKELIVIQVYI